MYNEVNKTKSIQENIAMECMIIKGYETHLDTSQTFVRQGMAPCLPPTSR